MGPPRIYAVIPLVIYHHELEYFQTTGLNGCLGLSHQYLGLGTAQGTEAVHDPKLLPGKTDNESYLQSEPHPIDMQYDRIYSMSDNQSDCQGDGIPNKLYYEASQHQSIHDIREFVLGLKEQAVLKILSPIVSDRDLQWTGSMEKMSHIDYQRELTVSAT